MNKRNIIALIFLALLTGSAVAEQGYGNIPEDKIYVFIFQFGFTNRLEGGLKNLLLSFRDGIYEKVRYPEASLEDGVFHIHMWNISMGGCHRSLTCRIFPHYVNSA